MVRMRDIPVPVMMYGADRATCTYYVRYESRAKAVRGFHLATSLSSIHCHLPVPYHL